MKDFNEKLESWINTKPSTNAGINNIQIEFKRNIYGEIEETEEEIKQKKKDALKEFLMKKQSLTLSGETREYTYWLILHRFKEKHNKFYTYLIEKKLMK